MVEADRFPRWSVFWRVWYSAEAVLGSLPIVLVAPTVAAVAATAWALSHPTQTIRKGLVVGEQPFWHALLNGVIGGVVGLLAVIGLISAVVWVWYRLLGGDRVWEAIYRGRRGEVYCFELRCKKNVEQVDPVHLGEVKCCVETPTGRVWEYAPAEEPGWPSSPSALEVLTRADEGPGRYRVRWCSTREGEQRREVARQRVTISADEPEAGTLARPWLERRR